MKYLRGQDEWHYDPCNFRSHLHENFEIIYMVSGECTATVNKREYFLKHGDWLVVFPFQIHEYISEGEENKFLCISLTAFRLMEFFPSAFGQIPADAKLSSENVPSRLKMLSDILQNTYDADFYTGICTSISQAILLELLSRMELVARSDMKVSDHEKIMLCCEERFRDNDFSLTVLSRKTGISTRTLSRFFSCDVKVSFSKFIALMRLSLVRELVRSKKYTITQAALESGFGTIRSFNIAFKNEYGMTPREFFK